MSDRSAAKRIPKSLGTDTKLLGGYTFSDAAVALFPAVLLLLATQLFLPGGATVAGYRLQRFMLPVAGVAVLVGATFVYLTPPYTTSLAWVLALVRFRTTPTRDTHDTAPDHTRLKRVHPEADAIERQDGTMIGLVQVVPPPMALATDEEWAAQAAAFQSFLNTTVTFPIQLYATTQPFPVDPYLDRYRERLDDPDVEATPQLQTLIEEYLDWYEQDLAARQMTIRDHYVVVTASPTEVRYGDGSLLETLSDLPVVGILAQMWAAPPLAQQRAVLFETLADRSSRVESGLRDIDGCDAHRLDAAEAASVIADYWGQSTDPETVGQGLRTRPLVDREEQA